MDQLSKLTNKKGTTILSQYTYLYDANGNIISVIDSKGTTSYVYDKLDRLIKIINPNGNTIIYTYDLRGNRKTEEHSSDTTIIQPNMSSYTYDVRDRVTSVNKNNVITSMKYNADGLRYQKTTGTNTTQYHYDLDGQVIAEGEAGNIKANYIWDASHVMMKKDVATGNKYFYLYNAHGDVVSPERQNNIILEL